VFMIHRPSMPTLFPYTTLFRSTISMKTLKLNKLAAGVGALALASGAAFSAQAADPVKVGYLIPLSSSAASSIGRDMSRATHLAVKHINEEGGIKSMDGAKLELVEVDTRGDPQVAITEAERLISNAKVSALIGSFQSSVTDRKSAV